MKLIITNHFYYRCVKRLGFKGGRNKLIKLLNNSLTEGVIINDRYIHFEFEKLSVHFKKDRQNKYYIATTIFQEYVRIRKGETRKRVRWSFNVKGGVKN